MNNLNTTNSANLTNSTSLTNSTNLTNEGITMNNQKTNLTGNTEKETTKVTTYTYEGNSTCSNCGADIVGDGYTSVQHCENAEEDTYDSHEPDANVVLCSVDNLNTTNSTNLTNEGITMNNQEINTSALTSTVAANLYHELGDTQQSIVLAACIADSYTQGEYFVDALLDGLNNATLKIRELDDNGSYVVTNNTVTFDGAKVEAALLKLEYITPEGLVGEKLQELLDARPEAYAPTTSEIVRRNANYGIEKGQASPLAIEAIKALESVPYTINDQMLAIANSVQTLLGGAKKDKEAYVLAGCNNMSSHAAYFSEFKLDRRIRLYQAACHGPIGAASDRSRALMDLYGVTTDYNIEQVKQVIRAEVMDMVTVGKSEVGKLMTRATKEPDEFLVEELAKDKRDRLAAKPWSFVKAAFTWKELAKGNRPYIGMAVGLDAKCSGPQYGSIMAGDETLAAACGLSGIKVEDAYELCLDTLRKSGFNGFTRAGIKKTYMGIFYGQGKGAFTQVANLIDDEQFELVELLAVDGVISEDVAERFHKAVASSFGTKLTALRARFLKYTGQVEGRTSHYMPDGSKVQMNYKHKVNINNVQMEHGVDAPDVSVETGQTTYKFIKFQLKTLEVHEGDFIRNGFVNMIQAVDALVARLIVVNLKRLGAQHIVSIHDCFRVNVTEMHLLEQAIKDTYIALFGSESNIKTADLPMGTDILGLYFSGVDESLMDKCSVQPIRQFFTARNKAEIRIMKKVNGVKLADLFNDLGNTYYFAK